jgi:soluble lytic murein transglycosylase
MMIRKRLSVPAVTGLVTLTLCLALPFPFVGPGAPPHYEPSLLTLAHKVSASAWLERTEKHVAFMLHALMRPGQQALVKAPTEETAKADAGPNSDLSNSDLPNPIAASEAAAPQTAEQASEQVADPGPDLTGLHEALGFYKAGDLAHGDEAAKTAKDDLVKLTIEWVAVRSLPHEAGFARLQHFAAAHPDWPALAWLRHRSEEALYADHRDKATVEAFFATVPPQTPLGKLALAQAFAADGRVPEAQKIVRMLWREGELNASLETKIRTDFGAYLEKSDFKSRADHLLYKEDVGPALRAAALAGPDVLALAKARVAVINEDASDKLLQAVPAPLKADPGYLFAEIQKLRRADKIKDAATVMLSAPRDLVRLVNGDEWWVERRLLSRKLLDQGDAKLAYRLCDEHLAQSNESKIEAEFHAGWIALRFLNDPGRALPHFAKVASLATTPMSIARAAYWQGRATEATSADDAIAKADIFYEKAAAYPSTYYGQLARTRLPTAAPLPVSSAITPQAPGEPLPDAVRVVALLLSVGEKDLATTLAVEAAQHLPDELQVAALASVVAKQQDAHLSLMIGKLSNQRGFALDQLAFPTYGIPTFEPLQNSADKAVVYSVARQESAFDPKALSHAGAMGLMQLIASTAKQTAMRAGLAFDANRLLADATFNAQLGAAHLGALLAEQRGSFILTFAAYNAGGKRVKQWIEAYGDPRTPGVDPIDWVERIPFTETRNYVQRVLENLAVYQSRFSEIPAADPHAPETKAEAKL